MNNFFISFAKAIYYNGYETFFDELKKQTHYHKNITYEFVVEYVSNCTPKRYYTTPNVKYTYEYGQVEIIWMILVLMFGNYGTSPRTGWIEKDKFPELINFIELLEGVFI